MGPNLYCNPIKLIKTIFKEPPHPAQNCSEDLAGALRFQNAGLQSVRLADSFFGTLSRSHDEGPRRAGAGSETGTSNMDSLCNPACKLTTPLSQEPHPQLSKSQVASWRQKLHWTGAPGAMLQSPAPA